MNAKIKTTSRNIVDTFKHSFKAWQDDHIFVQSAALSYYTVFSIAPLLLITIASLSFFFGKEAVSGEIYSSLRGLMGDKGAYTVQQFVEASALKKSGILASVIGVITLLIGATSTFAQLQDSLNYIWKVKRQPGNGFKDLIRQRLLSFSLILVIAFLLLVSLIVSAMLSGLEKYANHILPGGAYLWQTVNQFLSFSLTTLLFAAIFKILPDVKLAWKNVWFGGIITALLFTLGEMVIGMYLGKSGFTSTYGAAGSVLIILVWSYYSSAVLFFGAEITRFHSVNKQTLQTKEGSVWMGLKKAA